MATLPLNWNDPSFSGVTSSSSVTLRDGGTLSYKSITDTGSTASVVGTGSFSLDHVRINSREGVRIGGDGDVTISNSYLESTGQGNDHADTIQIYAPGSTGNVTITNTTIVAHNTAATAGNFGRDLIRDFKASGTAQDTIQFSKTVFDSFASVLSHASQDGQDVIISTGSDTLTLKNTKLSALNSNDFHFA